LVFEAPLPEDFAALLGVLEHDGPARQAAR
jgi:hypothetical protein